MYLIDQQMSWVLSRGLEIAFALVWNVFGRNFVIYWFDLMYNSAYYSLYEFLDIPSLTFTLFIYFFLNQNYFIVNSFGNQTSSMR